MQQAPLVDGVAFDPFSLLQNGLASPEVDIGRGEIAEALVVALVIVVIDEDVDPVFEITRQEVVLEQDAVLERLMPALDLALGLRMKRSAADMAHAVGVDPFGEFAGDVGRPVVAEQFWLVQHPVRRQGFWDRLRPDLREGLAHLVGLTMRRICGEASVAFRLSVV